MKKQIIIIAGLVSVIMTPRAPRKHSLRGWFWRGGWRSPDRRGVVRECKNTHLAPIVIASKAWRSSK